MALANYHSEKKEYTKINNFSWMSPEYIKGLTSIIVPTHNRNKLLIEAVESLAKQTYRPLEIIIIDDGSTDQTQSSVGELIQKYQQDMQLQINYFFQPQTGAQSARNLGLIKSQGEYIQFLDSDDILLPEKTAWGVAALKDSATSFIYFQTLQVNEELNPISNSLFGHDSSQWHNDVVDYLWHTSSPLFRRNVLREIGPWLETLTGSQDWEYGARIKLLKYSGTFEPKIGSLFRQHTQSRIGVSKFNYKYVYSAMLAYDNIVELADKLGSMNPELGNRFVRLYLTRALEFHSAGYIQERDLCLQKSLALPSQKNFVWLIAYMCRLFPNQHILSLIDQALTIRRNNK